MPSLLKRFLKRSDDDHPRLDDIKRYSNHLSFQNTKRSSTAAPSTRLDRLDNFRSRLWYRLYKLDVSLNLIDTRLDKINDELRRINDELREINNGLDKSK